MVGEELGVKGMWEKGGKVIKMLEGMGVGLSGRGEGKVEVGKLGGGKDKGTWLGGGSSGEEVLYGVDEEVGKVEVKGKVKK